MARSWWSRRPRRTRRARGASGALPHRRRARAPATGSRSIAARRRTGYSSAGSAMAGRRARCRASRPAMSSSAGTPMVIPNKRPPHRMWSAACEQVAPPDPSATMFSPRTSRLRIRNTAYQQPALWIPSATPTPPRTSTPRIRNPDCQPAVSPSRSATLSPRPTRQPGMRWMAWPRPAPPSLDISPRQPTLPRQWKLRRRASLPRSRPRRRSRRCSGSCTSTHPTQTRRSMWRPHRAARVPVSCLHSTMARARIVLPFLSRQMRCRSRPATCASWRRRKPCQPARRTPHPPRWTTALREAHSTHPARRCTQRSGPPVRALPAGCRAMPAAPPSRLPRRRRVIPPACHAPRRRGRQGPGVRLLHQAPHRLGHRCQVTRRADRATHPCGRRPPVMRLASEASRRRIRRRVTRPPRRPQRTPGRRCRVTGGACATPRRRDRRRRATRWKWGRCPRGHRSRATRLARQARRPRGRHRGTRLLRQAHRR